MTWWQILLICIGAVAVWIALSALLYKQLFKRFYDIVCSLLAIIVLSPLLFFLTFVGMIAMRGNPYYTQLRPGKKGKDGKEKIFKLIKFRTMSNEKDKNGNLLPDAERLNRYGKILRSTSLDELPELFNILIGNMSIVGPRPLLVEYLDRYSIEQRHRHDIRPGLTGYAQAHGRNAVTWEEKFKMDVWYTQHISLFGDLKIIMVTVLAVLKRNGINSGTSATMEEFKGTCEE